VVVGPSSAIFLRLQRAHPHTVMIGTPSTSESSSEHWRPIYRKHGQAAGLCIEAIRARRRGECALLCPYESVSRPYILCSILIVPPPLSGPLRSPDRAPEALPHKGAQLAGSTRSH
jgi:hypothetical protein